ncbi:MAG: hypothetical protein LBN27_01445 [Prevotellaceae bacterium]|jgi:hypothetical protein|nr:hypothetical protein [Prevotellaceae bacterium]
MKKYLIILVAVIGFGISANAQCYKQSYESNFKCGVYASITNVKVVLCDKSSYSSGYEDGWNGNDPKILKSLKVKAVSGVSCLVDDSSSCSSTSSEDISYSRGYTDGERDRKCQERKR